MATPNWIRLDTGYFSNAKVIAAGKDARDLHLAAICWAGLQETNGHIPAAMLPTLCRAAGVKRAALDRAVLAGLFVPNGDGWVLHDFDVMNGDQSPAVRQRAAWRDRQRRHRDVTGDT